MTKTGRASCYTAVCPPPVGFALSEIQAFMPDGPGTIIICPDQASSATLAQERELKPLGHNDPQAFSLRFLGDDILVLAHDVIGAMYGGLELAAAFRDQIDPRDLDPDQRPHVEHRGIKFNIPLDLRTPSYSDSGDAAQINIPHMWDFSFWQAFLDEMARDRLDVLSLWNLHPFPSLVKVPEYPEVALNDVLRTKQAFDPSFSLSAIDMYKPSMLADAEVVVSLSIDDKIAFWRRVMHYAQDRGVQLFWFTWNIHVFGTEGKYGITDDPDNPVCADYFRCSVRELVRTYPLLAGIGITAGEHMKSGSSCAEQENWLWQAYGQGVQDALSDQPERPFRLIHRAHMASYQEIASAWQDFPGTVDLSFKYAIAHMYSSPTPPFANETLPDVPPDLRLWMTVRNDDIYRYRWGDPDFARAFIRHLPSSDRCVGFYIGPDGHTWGHDTLSRAVDPACPLEIQRLWLTFRMWGLLAYNPDLPTQRFQAMLASRFPDLDSAVLMQACQAASRIIPAVNRAYWNPLDFHFFPEACTSHPIRGRGFHRIEDVLRGAAMPGSNTVCIADFCAAEGAQDTCAGITPPQTIAALQHDADQCLKLLANMQDHRCEDQSEAARMIDDWRAMALLGRYYAEKFSAALALGRWERDHLPEQHQRAMTAASQAQQHWRAYVAIAHTRYHARYCTRLGQVDLQALTSHVDDDYRQVSTWPSIHSDSA
ncbi:MAG: carbohydrate-binding family 6 protein [Planctomycetota bacterium]|jgi:hypothetical protein|nr:carbohydrate-binding family 6 protein [Planctomycetota bacterium]